MIIDAHTHIYPEAVAQRAIKTVIDGTKGQLRSYTEGTVDSLLASMDRAGVDYSVVLPIATDPRHGSGILEWIRTLLGYSRRLIFFGSVHPYDPEYPAIIQQMKDMGIRGIKMHPAYQNFPADDPEAYKVYEEVLRNDLILHFHAGYDMSMPESDYPSVERFARVVGDFSGSKIILAHAGGDGEWGKVLKLMDGKRCYYDVSFVLESMQQCDNARELYCQNEDYFLFGTDSPWRDQQQYVTLIRNSSFLTETQKRKLFHLNLNTLGVGPG